MGNLIPKYKIDPTEVDIVKNKSHDICKFLKINKESVEYSSWTDYTHYMSNIKININSIPIDISLQKDNDTISFYIDLMTQDKIKLFESEFQSIVPYINKYKVYQQHITIWLKSFDSNEQWLENFQLFWNKLNDISLIFAK